MPPDKDIDSEKKALIDKLTRMIAEDAQEARTINARLKENKALLASLKKHGHRPPVLIRDTVTKRQTRLQYGPRYEAITAINSFVTRGEKTFTGSQLYEEVKKLFPGTTMTRAHLSSLLWKLSSSDKPKDRLESIRKVSTSKGGKTESEYEKISVNGTNGAKI